MLRIILIATLLITASCSTGVVQKLDSKILYKRDMYVNVDGFEGVGTLVVPDRSSHKFHAKAKGKLDLFTLNTCHREWTKEKAWNVTTKKKAGPFGLWKKTKIQDKEIKFDFFPTILERENSCITELGGYEIKLGQHSWALIDYETPEAKLPAFVSCNGNEYNSRGVSICQAKKGLIQAIRFPVDVITSPDPDCDLPTKTGKYFEYPIKKGRCVYAFMEKKSPHRVHRLTTFGYEQLLIRMEK